MKKLLTAMFCIAISTAVLTATVIATGCTDKFAPKDKNYFEFRIVNNTVYRVIELESETPERVDDYPLVSAANINFSDPTPARPPLTPPRRRKYQRTRSGIPPTQRQWHKRDHGSLKLRPPKTEG